MNNQKILYISDSLGTPIPHRGIFNFSVAFVEKLKKSNAEVTLLVERPDGQGIRKHWLESGIALEKSMDPWQNAEIFRYLTSGHFHCSLDLNEHIEFAARDAAHYRVVKFLEQNSVEHIETRIRNIDNDFYLDKDDQLEIEAKRLKKTTRIEFIANYFNKAMRPYHSESTHVHNSLITETNKYLQMFDGFLSIDNFYSNSLTRAHNFIPPYSVDCSRYDEVIIDGPHYLSLSNIDPGRVSLIIYDLIPLKNSSLAEESHRSFSQKLFASLEIDANIVFISESSQREFHDCFRERSLRSERIIYPPVRNILTRTDEHRLEAKRYLAQIAQSKNLSKSNTDRVRRKTTEKITKIFSQKPRLRLQLWNSMLPYFVTVLSDEPYKNASVCVSAFEKLRTRANLLIVGRLDPSKYVGETGVENIHFTGFISDKLKNELIAESAGLIFPSFYEGFGIPVLEGALQGVPVLCSSIDVFREIVEKNALYFNPDDPDDLHARILDTLADPVAAKSRATAATAFVREKFL